MLESGNLTANSLKHYYSIQNSILEARSMRTTILSLAILFIAGTTLTEAKDIVGRVIDSNGQPLTGATILIEETGQGAASDEDGYFRLSGIERDTTTLIVRFIGYESRYVAVDLTSEEPERLEIVLESAVVRTDEMLVTASLFERITRYQPARSYNASELQMRNTSSMGTLIDGEPGVAMRSFGHAPARPVIRGMDGERIQVLQNGMKMGDISATAHDHAVMLDPQAVDQLDIIRGPASLIYGSSAMGGIINAHSNDIPSGWANGSSGYIGGQGQTGINALSGSGRYTYGADSWAMTLRSSLKNTGNMQTPIGEIPGTDLKAMHLASGLAYRTTNTHYGGSLHFTDQSYGIPEDPFDLDEEVVLKMQRLAFQGSIRHDISHDFWRGVELRTTYNYYMHEELEREFVDGVLDEEDLELGVDQDYAQVEILAQHGSFGFVDNGTIGASLEYYGMEVGGEEALTPDANGWTIAGFLVEEIMLTDKWMLQSGLRLEWNRTESLSNPDFPDAGQVRNQGIWAASIGLNGPVAENTRLGFQLSRSHRVPSVEELFSDALHLGAGAYEIGDPELENEIGYGLDLFLDYDTPSRNIHLALYANRISGYITLVPTGEREPVRGLPVLKYHGSDADLFGGELVLRQQITEAWRVSTQADYIYGRERADQGKSPLPYMPPLRLEASTEYDKGNWWARGDVSKAFNQNRTATQEESTDGYLLTEIAAGLRLGDDHLHHITLTIENLFDVTWQDHLSRIEQRDIPMMGRNIRLSYRYYY